MRSKDQVIKRLDVLGQALKTARVRLVEDLILSSASPTVPHSLTALLCRPPKNEMKHFNGRYITLLLVALAMAACLAPAAASADADAGVVASAANVSPISSGARRLLLGWRRYVVGGGPADGGANGAGSNGSSGGGGGGEGGVRRGEYPRPSADAPSPPTCWRPYTCQKLRERGLFPPECGAC